MAENSPSGKDVKAPNVFERVKEEFDAVLHSHKNLHNHQKETRGLRNAIDENTSNSDVKAPNMFDRAKEEIEALVETLHPKKETKSHSSPPNNGTWDPAMKDRLESKKPEPSEKNVKSPNFIDRAKEEIGSLMHKDKSPRHHHKETHGRNDDIDENTPLNDVKAPNVFERAKEEVEGLIQTIHPKKDSGDVSSSKKEGGLPVSIGKGLEKLCSPRSHKEDSGDVSSSKK